DPPPETQFGRNGVRARNGGQGDASRSAHRRGANHPVAGRAGTPATSQELARRLAQLAVLLAAKPTLAVSLSGTGDVHGRRPAVARVDRNGYSRRRRGVQLPHADPQRDYDVDRGEKRRVLGSVAQRRLAKGLAAPGRRVSSDPPPVFAGAMPGGGGRARRGRLRGGALCPVPLVAAILRSARDS